MSREIKALKSGVWYTASNFLVKGIGFITTPIFTRLLTKTEFGEFNNYLSWLSIITIFATINLESSLISARYDYKGKFDEYILSVLSLSFLSSVTWLAIVNVFPDYFQSLLDLDIIYINAMFLYLICLPALQMYQLRERYHFEYKKTVLTSVILSLSTTLLSLALVVFMENRLTGRIFGAVIPTVVMGTIFYVYFFLKGKKIKVSYWKYALPICIPYIPHLLSMTILNSSDRVMINKWCGSEETALYSLAYSCGTIITLLHTSINGAFAPWLGEQLDNHNYAKIREVSKIYVGCGLFAVVGIMLVSPEILFILGGKAYAEAKYVLAPVSMGCFLQFLYVLFVNVEQFKKKTVGMAIASVIAAFINIVLNFIYIPRYGYLAAAYTTFISYLCLLLMHMYLVHRLKLGMVYDYKYIGTALILGMFAMFAITLLYGNNHIRYSCIFGYISIVVIIGYRNRKYISNMLKKQNPK